MYTRPSLQKTQEFRPIPGHHQPKLAAWSSVLLDRRSGCEHQHFFFFSPLLLPQFSDCWGPSRKIQNEEEENRSVHAVLSPLLAWSLLPSARYCMYQLPFFFCFSAQFHRPPSQVRYICENDFKLSLQKLECDTISSLPPDSAVYDGVETILLGDPGLRAFRSNCGLSGEVPLTVRAKRCWRLGSVGAVWIWFWGCLWWDHHWLLCCSTWLN